ncbi:MAG: hypothetical protein RR951_09115 [Ruthenibacterium sp.]
MKIKNIFKTIRLADRCLILLMVLLLAQSAYSLFAHEANSQETAAIDIVVRTTSAAIFGYFLSSNFIKNGMSAAVSRNSPADASVRAASAQIAPAADDKSQYNANGEQIIIATAIGVFSLLVLIITRNFVPISPGMTAAISQLRDFVSGCVGFLLGSSEVKRR